MRNTLAEFQRDIGHLNRVADWLSSPAALSPGMLPAVKAITCGCVVLLSGYFESFLKDCMRAFIGGVNELNKPFNALPGTMRYTHFKKGVNALLREVTNDKKNGDTVGCENVATRLASVGSGIPYQLVWEAFAETRANPGPEVIRELTKAVGVNDVWKEMLVIAPGKGNLETFLRSFMAIRNECAHTGSTTTPPSATSIVEYGENLLAIAEALIVLLENRLAVLGVI